MPALLALDTSNLVFRIYHAAAASGKEMAPHLLAWRLRKSVTALLEQVEPVRLVAAIDTGNTFRKQLHGGYKGHRSERPEALDQFLKRSPEILAEMGAEVLWSAGHEADDVLATVADRCLMVGGWRTLIVSNDADVLSLICRGDDDAGTFVLKSGKNGYTLQQEQDVIERYGVPPLRLSLWKAIAGDTSDAVGGITGLGPKAATRLAARYSSMDELYDALETPLSFTRGERELLLRFTRERALLMERLTALVRNAPLQVYPCPIGTPSSGHDQDVHTDAPRG